MAIDSLPLSNSAPWHRNEATHGLKVVVQSFQANIIQRIFRVNKCDPSSYSKILSKSPRRRCYAPRKRHPNRGELPNNHIIGHPRRLSNVALRILRSSSVRYHYLWEGISWIDFSSQLIRPMGEIQTIEEIFNSYSMLKISPKYCVDSLRNKCIRQLGYLLP